MVSSLLYLKFTTTKVQRRKVFSNEGSGRKRERMALEEDEE